jgi:glycine/D-amino acid oxidase-like deaminating enzyme
MPASERPSRQDLVVPPRTSNLPVVLGAAACYYDVEDREEFILEALAPRSFVMSGFSGHGFKFAPLLGLALAAAAEDTTLARALPGWAAGRDAPAPGLLAGLESTT